ncbi:MAG TPA: AzlC family ABC transporter permease [Anaerolineales bacterium]|nr:AzlC family ABC transporter permease [Anaerolineales bacterium]
MSSMTEESPDPVSSRRTECKAGMRETLPLVVGAIPFGIIFGAVAITNGLSPAGTIGMSLFVFAGASQFIAAGLFGAGAGAALIVLTTFIVNLRHLLYGVSLSPYLKHLPRRWMAPLAFWLTDETYLVSANHFDRDPDRPDKEWYMLGSSLFMYINWQLCTVIGILAGRAIPNPAAWGLDFAMVVTFIGMLIPRLTSRPMVAAALTAGVVAIAADPLPNQIGLFLATLTGIATGLAASRIWREPAKTEDRTSQEGFEG